MKITLARLGLVALVVGAIAGCGGGNDGGVAVPGGGGGGGGGGGALAPARVPAGKAPITVSTLTPAQFAALAFKVEIGGAIVGSPPQVSFAISDANDNAIIGWGSKSQSATAPVASYPNLSFALAKLVPGTGGAPSRWVNYIVTSVPTYTSATDKTILGPFPQRPSTDNTGTLVDNGNGTYTYTFYRDVTTIKTTVAGLADNPSSSYVNQNKNDLDDLSYDPTLVHRLTIQISGNAPGTGTNTPDAVEVTPGVPMANPLNIIYDFIPATGKAVTATDPGREIVATAKCNECHQSLGGFPTASEAESDATFHGGNRNNTQYCVVCHTEQRKYGRAEAVVNGAGNYDGLSTYRINGLAVGNLRQHIHKIHMSAGLTKTGYNYGGILYEEACKMPQDIRNCTKCHDGSATSTAKTAQGDNWKNVPSRAACGSCHDGINFATGKGLTLEDARNGLTTSQYGHIGGAQADDSKCALCHGPAAIDVYHLPVTPPNLTNALLLGGTNSNTNAAWIASNTSRLPEGAIKVTYDIKSVSRNASKQPVMVFRILRNGVRRDFNNPASATEMWPGFMGSPSAYFVFAVPQDGITAPADFNASVSGYLRNIWNGTATGSSAGTLTGPDADGYYTVTLTGVIIPDEAVMLTGGVGYSYSVKTALPLTQTNLADYPVANATADPATLTPGMPNKTGGLIVIAPNVQKVATGYTGRRAIVEDARCNKCHQELGTFTEEAFHAGQRNDGTTCSWCHTPNRTSSGWSADSTSFVHGIHAAAKRAKQFTWHAASTTDGFWKIGYPGILTNCETCHLPNTYDFSASASASALPNRQFRTVATGLFNGTVGTLTTGCTISATNNCLATDLSVFSLSPYVTADNATNYGSGFSFSSSTGTSTPAAGTTLVNSPIATQCVACHDSDLAVSHMKSNGGSFYAARSTALATAEQCTLCHLSGKVADIKVMHAK